MLRTLSLASFSSTYLACCVGYEALTSMRVFHFDVLHSRADSDGDGRVMLGEACSWLSGSRGDSEPALSLEELERQVRPWDRDQDEILLREEWFPFMWSLIGRFPVLHAPQSAFRIQPCSSVQAHPEVKRRLKMAGLVKCARPMGMLVAGELEYPDSYLLFAANIVGEFLDPASDGTLDRRVIAALTEHRADGPFLAGFRSPPSDAACDDDDGCFDLLSRLAIDGARDVRRGLVEEVHHFLLQFGWAEAYPEVFGIDDWTSTIAKEKMRAECVWFHHPENFPVSTREVCERECPGACDRVCEGPSCFQCSWRLRQARDEVRQVCLRTCPAGICEEGGCTDPDCDVTEFYFRAHMAFMGDKEAFLLEPMTQRLVSNHNISDLLSSAMFDVFTSPRYRQRRSPVTGMYTVSHAQEL